MRNSIVISLSFFTAYCLTILPMPSFAEWGRPQWVLLVFLYWIIVDRDRLGLGSAFFAGLLLDLLSGSLLGEHAFAFVFIAYVTFKMVLRIRMYPLFQQTLSIFCFTLLYQFVIFCIQGFMHELPNHYLYWLSSITSTLLWPWVFVLMRDYCRWFRVA